MNTAASNISLTSLDKRLLSWLDSDTPRFERYIAAHPEAADRIDQLLSLGDDVQRLLSSTLDDVLAVPHDLMGRLSAALGTGEDTGAATVGMDLFGIATDTFTIWLNP
jgi:hypothetical protein